MAGPAPAAPAEERAGLVEQLTELDTRFWIVNTMEMFERLAYYGVRAVIAIYMVLPLELGGPEFTHVQKGAIFAAWAAVQSLLPMFTGGFADRYGHKRTIAAAIIIKIFGYLAMAHFKSYPLFFLGCVLLAGGTAIFKPGVQGTLAATLKQSNASVGWGIFYQLVNVGGFLGPVLAGVLRLMDWVYVFYACAIIVSINFLWLPFYRDPTQEGEGGTEVSEEEEEAAQKLSWSSLAQSVSATEAARWATFFGAMSAAWFFVGLVGGAFVGDLTGVGETAPPWRTLAMGVGAAGGLAGLAGAVMAQVPSMRRAGAAVLWLLLLLTIGTLATDVHAGPVAAYQAIAHAHEGLWGLVATFVGSGSYVATTGALLGAALLGFAASKERFDAGDTSPWGIFTVSVAGLFQPRVLWFCLVFSGFWLMFNQVFDLLPNVIDDWVDSSGIIAALGGAFRSAGVPTVLAVLGSVLFGLVCGAIVMLALRPDRRDRTQVGLPAWTVAGIGVAMGAWFALSPLVGSVSAAVARAGFEGTPLPNLAAVGVMLAVVAVVALVGKAMSLPAKPVAGVATLLAALAGTLTLRQSFIDAGPTLVAMAEAGEQVNPEWMINLNPGLIVFTMIFFAWLSSFVRPLTSIVVGMIVATVGSIVAGTATVGWITLAGILVFSVGEMLSSPKKMEYLASLAKKGQEGLFMGYANVPVAIGWISGSIFAGNRYEEHGDKANLARQYLVEEQGWTAQAAEELPRSEVVSTLAGELGKSTDQVRDLLFSTYHPEQLWIDIGLIGLVSIIGMIVYDRVLKYVDGRKAGEQAA